MSPNADESRTQDVNLVMTRPRGAFPNRLGGLGGCRVCGQAMLSTFDVRQCARCVRVVHLNCFTQLTSANGELFYCPYCVYLAERDADAINVARMREGASNAEARWVNRVSSSGSTGGAIGVLL